MRATCASTGRPATPARRPMHRPISARRLLGSPSDRRRPRSSTPAWWPSAPHVWVVPARVVTGADPGAGVSSRSAMSRRGWSSSSPTAPGARSSRTATRGPAPSPRTPPRTRSWGRRDGSRTSSTPRARSRIPKGADIELPPDTVFEEQTDPWQVVGLAVAGLLGLLLLAWLAVPGLKLLRRRRRRTAGGWSGIYVNGWQEVLDAARDRGTPVPDAWSRASQAASLGVGLDLARRADVAVFAPGPAVGEDGAAFWDACQDLRRALLAEVDVRRRLWAHLNPASLLAGWARSRTREDVSRAPGARRRSPSPESAARGRVTSRPRPGRGPRATPARRGRRA